MRPSAPTGGMDTPNIKTPWPKLGIQNSLSGSISQVGMGLIERLMYQGLALTNPRMIWKALENMCSPITDPTARE